MANITATDVGHRFNPHHPSPGAAMLHDQVRRAFLSVGHELVKVLPEGREKSLAFTALEEASFWANAAVARDGAAEEEA